MNNDTKTDKYTAQKLVNSAFSILQKPAAVLTNNSNVSSTTNSSREMETSPEDIPKEELVQLCMKMNKRMQAMESKGQELIRKKNTLLNDKKVLLDFLKSIPLLINVQDDQEVHQEVLSNCWKQYLTGQTDYISQLESKLASSEYLLSQAEAKYKQEILVLKSSLNSDSITVTEDNITVGHVSAVKKSTSSNFSDSAIVENLNNEIMKVLKEKEVRIISVRYNEKNMLLILSVQYDCVKYLQFYLLFRSRSTVDNGIFEY